MAGRFFNKLKSGATSFFNKVKSDGPTLMRKISNTMGDVGTIVRKAENTGRDVLSNPLIEAGASMVLGPEAGVAMEAGNALLGNLGDAGKLAKQASNLTDVSSYKGGVQGVSQDILQRSKNLQGNANAVKQNVQNQFV